MGGEGREGSKDAKKFQSNQNTRSPYIFFFVSPCLVYQQ